MAKTAFTMTGGSSYKVPTGKRLIVKIYSSASPNTLTSTPGPGTIVFTSGTDIMSYVPNGSFITGFLEDDV